MWQRSSRLAPRSLTSHAAMKSLEGLLWNWRGQVRRGELAPGADADISADADHGGSPGGHVSAGPGSGSCRGSPGRDYLAGWDLHPSGRGCRFGDATAGDDRGAPMIVPPSGVRVWLANGHTDMRRGMNGLSLQVQEALQRDPHAGDLYVFRGRRGDLVKDPVARWARHVALRQAARAWTLSLGRLQRTAAWRFRPPSSATCWTASTGGTRNAPGGLRRRAEGYTGSPQCGSLPGVIPGSHTIPDDIAALRAALAAEQLARREAEARASGAEAIVAHLKLLIAKLRHEQFGASSERGRKLLDQLELQLEELEAGAAEDEAALDPDPAGSRNTPGSIRRKPVRGPLPAHLPRERVVIPVRPPARAVRASCPSWART